MYLAASCVGREAGEITMSVLEDRLNQAERGDLSACMGCPWNPKTALKPVAFGTSCTKHGADWRTGAPVVSMSVVQDPSDTTPSSTGLLCHFCNSSNPSDRSAQNTHALWSAAVARQGNDFLNTHYWTNAAMHGLSGGKVLDAVAYCSVVLKQQIELLKPAVIIANGTAAAAALHQLGALRKKWSGYRKTLGHGVYRERYGEAHVFVTYHPSAKNININIPKQDLSSVDTLLARSNAESAPEVADFLKSTKGANLPMRCLLLHWLEIGEEIRRAAGGG